MNYTAESTAWSAPDYANSIVNLVSSLAGPKAPAADLYPPLSVLDSFRLQQRPVALLIIDGLGYRYLCRHPESCLYQDLIGSLSSVFPTTTATAVTALALGVPAQQHGITGWFTYFRELGCVAAPLPFGPRGGGQGFDSRGVRAEQLLDAPPLLSRLDRPAVVISPFYIVDSAYTKALFGATERRAHRRLADLFSQIGDALLEGGSPLVWSYWTELDGLAHQYGIDSVEVSDHFKAIDQHYGELMERLKGSDAVVIVTADHGLIDTSEQRTVSLSEHPQLAETLQLPLCGEPRAAFCYLRAGCEARFDNYVADHLSAGFEAYPSDELLHRGWFGNGPVSGRCRERIGDRVLLPKENWIIKDRLLQETPFTLVGVHGGLSEEERRVPLIVSEF